MKAPTSTALTELPASSATGSIEGALAIGSPQESGTAGVASQEELLLADILAKMAKFATLRIWSDEQQQILENQIDAILQNDSASSITSDQSSLAHRLWDKVVGMNSKLLRWEFVAALRRLDSEQAIALEAYIVEQLLTTHSAGDKIAAIESIWNRDTYRARRRLRKMLKDETDSSVRQLIEHYVGASQDAGRVSSAA